jgi:hypothetical protein
MLSALVAPVDIAVRTVSGVAPPTRSTATADAIVRRATSFSALSTTRTSHEHAVGRELAGATDPEARWTPAGTPARAAAVARAITPARQGSASSSDQIAAHSLAGMAPRLPIAPPRGAGGPIRRATEAALDAGNRGGMAASPASAGGPIRRSLVESTAEAFAKRAMAAPATPAVAAGISAFAGGEVIRRAVQIGSHRTRSQVPHQATTHNATVGEASTPAFDVNRLPARDFQRLVDAVVEALEQRVIDELERRGRRHPGVL